MDTRCCYCLPHVAVSPVDWLGHGYVPNITQPRAGPTALLCEHTLERMGDDGVRVPHPFLPGLLDPTYLEGNLNLLFFSFAILPSLLQVAALGMGHQLEMMVNRKDTQSSPSPFSGQALQLEGEGKGTCPRWGQGLTLAMISAYAIYK